MYRFPYCLIILVLLGCGGQCESEVEVCEYEDANLLFPNTPVSSASDIRAKTWNKENDIRVASWMANITFVPSPPYRNRLMAIGENSIKIRNAKRSDTGTYTLVLTCGSTQVFTDFILHLEVLVPPTIQCIPNITREGDTLMSVLPPDDCGIPRVSPSWMSDIQTLINSNTSFLNFELKLVPEIYTACAIGKSIRCFHGDVYKLCSNYTVSALQPQNDSSSVSVVRILVVISFYIVIGVVLALMYWKREPIKRKLFSLTEINEIMNNRPEETALVNEETTAKALTQTETTGEEKTPMTELTSKVKATAGTRNKDTKLQGHDPGILALTQTETTGEEETPMTELTSKVKATAGTRNKDTKLQEKLQMQKKQGHDPGSYDSRVEEGIQGVQSREEPIQEEQCIFNERDEKMNEEVQRIQDQLLCRICQKENACIVFLPCLHHTACFACTQKLKNCNVCQQEIKRLVMPFATLLSPNPCSNNTLFSGTDFVISKT